MLILPSSESQLLDRVVTTFRFNNDIQVEIIQPVEFPSFVTRRHCACVSSMFGSVSNTDENLRLKLIVGRSR